LACFLIPFAIVLLWKNEKKLVTYTCCVDKAANECVPVNIEDPNEMNNYKLVYLSGKTENKTSLCDNSFEVTVGDSYRLKRIVEMFQWQETKKVEDRNVNGSTITTTSYTYNKVWSSRRIDSSHFSKSGFDNPS